MRAPLLTLVVLVGICPAARAQSASPIDGVAMVREMKIDPTGMSGSSMELRYDAYVLFRGGISMRGIPSGAPSDWNADSLARVLPQYTGRWSEVGGALHIVTTRGDTKNFTDWFRMTPGQPDQRLDGVWRRAAAITQQTSGRTTAASVARELALHPDGRFVSVSAGGASSGGVVTATQRASTGRYRIDNFQIEFRYDDGQIIRQLFCASSDENTTLLIGGARLSKRK